MALASVTKKAAAPERIRKRILNLYNILANTKKTRYKIDHRLGNVF